MTARIKHIQCDQEQESLPVDKIHPYKFSSMIPLDLRALLPSKMGQTDPLYRLGPTGSVIVEFSPIFKLSTSVRVLPFQLPQKDDSQLSCS